MQRFVSKIYYGRDTGRINGTISDKIFTQVRFGIFGRVSLVREELGPDNCFRIAAQYLFSRFVPLSWTNL